MRIFEIVLITANLLALVLNFRNQSRRVRLWILAINLAVFVLHGIVEGFRYPMYYSYIFVVFLTIVTVAKGNRKTETRISKAWKAGTAALSFLFLTLTALAASALPVFSLPKPTGGYSVGIQYFHLVDENRTDPFLDGSSQKRELMVKIYYPAQQDDSKPFDPYFHSPQLLKSFAEFYGMPDFAFDHLNLVKTSSKVNLQIADNRSAYPVILYSHGAGTSMEVQTTQSEDLASHGYIVVAIDHTYVSAATIFPDRIASHHEATTNFNTAEPAEIITQIMADDASFVIDILDEMNEGKTESIFQGRLNMDSIGAIGHSVGGAVAYNLVNNDPRVRAAINLDGVVYITPKNNPETMPPFLMLVSDNEHIQSIRNREPLMKKFEDMDEVEQKITLDLTGSKEAYQEAYDRALQNVNGLAQVLQVSGNVFTIQGSDHMKFTDIGLYFGFPQLRELLGIRGKTDPGRCLEITMAVTRTFFDHHIRGETDDSWDLLLETFHALKRVPMQ